MSYITVKNLQKNYTIYEKTGRLKRNKRIVKALNHIDFTVEEGAFLGYIGPNGAGKSTTIKVLTGIMTPDGGEAKVGSYVPYKDRKAYVQNIGVVFGQKTQMWWDLPVIDTYRLLGGIYKVPQKAFKRQLEYLCDRLDLTEILHQPVRQLSLGQRMRAELGAAMIHDPKILFLDEPTIGLDIISKQKVNHFLTEMNQGGKTIFLTTHDLKDIESLCEEMLILSHGEIVYKGAIDQLKSNTELPILVTAQLPLEQPLDALHHLKERYAFSFDQARSQLEIQLTEKKQVAELARTLFHQYDIQDFRVDEPSIEEIIKKIYT